MVLSPRGRCRPRSRGYPQGGPTGGQASIYILRPRTILDMPSGRGGKRLLFERFDPVLSARCGRNGKACRGRTFVSRCEAPNGLILGPEAMLTCAG